VNISKSKNLFSRVLVECRCNHNNSKVYSFHSFGGFSNLAALSIVCYTWLCWEGKECYKTFQISSTVKIGYVNFSWESQEIFYCLSFPSLIIILSGSLLMGSISKIFLIIDFAFVNTFSENSNLLLFFNPIGILESNCSIFHEFITEHMSMNECYCCGFNVE
jgi:hypothetical protein